MSVLIHPTATNPNCITALQQETGMRAVVRKTFAVLVHANGQAPKMREHKPVRIVKTFSPFDGGGSAA